MDVELTDKREKEYMIRAVNIEICDKMEKRKMWKKD